MTSESRYHSLDVLRASALLLGIGLHATMSFLPGFRSVGWPIVDVSESTALAWVYFVVHIFRMTLFFLIAGFFARLLHSRLGTSGFCKHRLRRIGLPLLVSMLVVMPLAIVPLVVAVRTHGGGGGAYAALRPEGGIPWGHLWFLYLLLVLYALLLAVRAAGFWFDRSGRGRQWLDQFIHRLTAWRLLPIALAAPLCVTLYLTPWWQEWDGIPAPVTGFIPNLPAMLAFGSAMLVGWFLHRQQALLALLARDWTFYALVAAGATAVASLLISPDAQLRIAGMSPEVRLVYASGYTLAIWSWCLALVGFAVRFHSGESAVWRYLADASYWLYITHIPVVWGLQAWMMDWPLSWAVKYPLILGITLGLLLLVYHHAVRGTFIGQFLNGRRIPKAA